MLHILLILLKIIGIILLACLALVALLFILPASYKIEGIKNKEQSYLTIHGGWLFHILHFNMEYSEELKYSLRILGFKIYSDDNDENADDSYETFENDEKYEKRGRTEDNDKNMNSVESDDFIKAGQEFKGDNIEGKALANSQKNLDK